MQTARAGEDLEAVQVCMLFSHGGGRVVLDVGEHGRYLCGIDETGEVEPSPDVAKPRRVAGSVDSRDVPRGLRVAPRDVDCGEERAVEDLRCHRLGGSDYEPPEKRCVERCSRELGELGLDGLLEPEVEEGPVQETFDLGGNGPDPDWISSCCTVAVAPSMPSTSLAFLAEPVSLNVGVTATVAVIATGPLNQSASWKPSFSSP